VVGRITAQEGDGLGGANETMLEAKPYICSSEGSGRRFFLKIV
jgi:hypothetical protein